MMLGSNFWGLGSFLMNDIVYILFACYPTKSDTSHDGGIVGLLYLRHISHVHLLLWLIVNFLFQGATLKETEGPLDVLSMQMSLQVCRGSVCSLPHLTSVTYSYLEQSVQTKK
jgi:hypothetical protein